MRYISSSDRNWYNKDICELPEAFIRNFNYHCSYSHYDHKFLAIPNTHRLVGLYFHILPLLIHALLLFEMQFQSHNPPLKSGITKNSNYKSYISTVQHILRRDWTQRVHEARCFSAITNSNMLQIAMENLRLLFWSECDILLENKSAKITALPSQIYWIVEKMIWAIVAYNIHFVWEQCLLRITVQFPVWNLCEDCL